MRNLLFAFLAILLPFQALAATGERPSEIAPYIKAEAPYGQARLTKMVFRVYDATLWTDAPVWTMKKPFALALRYGMSFTGKNLAKRSIDEIKRSASLTPADAASYMAQLLKLFPDVEKNDTITAIYLPAKETRLYYNGKYTGHISDPVFSERFIGIWMSSKTSEPAVRQKLISKG